mmetsp:Transcript_30922/g.100677  ORF Transcript_30922/g.100677 Transcript_30922/m.100677 type:complete len:191 (+) Transcript_30922:2385-2957(+)
MSNPTPWAFVVVFVATLSSLFAELVSWVLIYRTASYRNLRSTIDRQSKRVEGLKAKTAKNETKKEKKVSRAEESLKTASRDLGMIKMRSTIVTWTVGTIIYSMLGSIFEGQPVARIPFQPFQIFQSFSHRGLPGEDYTEASMAFVYMLSMSCIKGNVQKILGFAPPRQNTNVDLWAQSNEQANKIMSKMK